MIRVLAYTPEPLISIALDGLISQEPDVALVTKPTRAQDLAAEAVAEQPDVALIMLTADIDWGVLLALRSAAPAMKIVLWVQEISTEMAHQALHIGVKGILRRTLPPAIVGKCIHKVHEGELWFEKALTDAFLSGRKVNLSRRESQLVKLLAQGLKNKELATELGISEGTIKVYLSKLYDKVGAKDRFELALFGLRNMQCGTAAEVSHDMPMRNLFLTTPAPAPKPSQQRERAWASFRVVA